MADAAFFTEFERFDRHVEKLRRGPEGERVHYLSICSPNYLHDAHIRFALRVGAHAICEKPLVLNPWNLDALAELEKESGRRVYTVLQLRLHPAVLAFREALRAQAGHASHEVDLTYCTPRGAGIATRGRGRPSKSGGVATNIGIHFFDLLHLAVRPRAVLRRCICASRRASAGRSSSSARACAGSSPSTGATCRRA